MKMPDKIEEVMFAPCGMNCMVCYKHCYTKKPCEGCFNSDIGKPEHCRKCKIKQCTAIKCVKYCFECNEFPCKFIKNLEKSYKIRYSISLIENSMVVKQEGLEAFMKRQQYDYKCDCGGIISLHDAECSECKKTEKVRK